MQKGKNPINQPINYNHEAEQGDRANAYAWLRAAKHRRGSSLTLGTKKMTKTRILLCLLGFLNLLIPIGKCAEYIISVRKGLDFLVEPIWLAEGFIGLCYALIFLYLGIRLANLLQNMSRLPHRLVDGFLAASAVWALFSYIAGYGVNAIGLVIAAAIHWYFSRKFKTLGEEYESEPELTK